VLPPGPRTIGLGGLRRGADAADRFLLSKGHGPAAYYAVLAAKGFFPEWWLADFGSASSRLGYHPDRNLIPGVEIASGSLGHGLPLGVGLAHGLIARGPGGIEAHFAVSGWSTVRVSGRDHAALAGWRWPGVPSGPGSGTAPGPPAA